MIGPKPEEGAPVSPGSRPRPSLSEEGFADQAAAVSGGVAGVSAPAFVERAFPRAGSPPFCPRVAGVSAPAFVERGRWLCLPGTRGCVAGVSAPAFVERSTRSCQAAGWLMCRRGLGPGLR